MRLCDIQINQGRDKGYQPKLRLKTLLTVVSFKGSNNRGLTLTVAILHLTKEHNVNYLLNE